MPLICLVSVKGLILTRDLRSLKFRNQMTSLESHTASAWYSQYSHPACQTEALCFLSVPENTTELKVPSARRQHYRNSHGVLLTAPAGRVSIWQQFREKKCKYGQEKLFRLKEERSVESIFLKIQRKTGIYKYWIKKTREQWRGWKRERKKLVLDAVH